MRTSGVTDVVVGLNPNDHICRLRHVECVR